MNPVWDSWAAGYHGLPLMTVKELEILKALVEKEIASAPSLITTTIPRQSLTRETWQAFRSTVFLKPITISTTTVGSG